MENPYIHQTATGRLSPLIPVLQTCTSSGTYIIYTYRTQPEVEKRGPTSTRLAYVLVSIPGWHAL